MNTACPKFCSKDHGSTPDTEREKFKVIHTLMLIGLPNYQDPLNKFKTSKNIITHISVQYIHRINGETPMIDYFDSVMKPT